MRSPDLDPVSGRQRNLARAQDSAFSAHSATKNYRVQRAMLMQGIGEVFTLIGVVVGGFVVLFVTLTKLLVLIHAVT